MRWTNEEWMAYRIKEWKHPKKKALPGRLKMNKTEERYADHLRVLQAAGEIDAWWFEPVKLRLGPNWKTGYTPDFMVLKNCGGVRIDEVKGGYIRDDALVKFKGCAEMYPCFRWRMVRWKSGVWEVIMEF